MARVPAVANISKDTSTPEQRTLDIDDDAGVLDVDAEIPDDFDWDALPDDDEPVSYSDDEDPPPNPPNDQQNQNGHASPPAPSSQSPDSSAQNCPRSDGVVADPIGIHRLEEGEIDQKKFFKKKKKKRKPDSQKLHCEVCNTFVVGQVTMDSHLKGQRHMANSRQAALKIRNKKVSLQANPVQSQNKPPVEPRRPEDDWDSTNSPPRPVPKPPSAPPPSAEDKKLSGKTEVASDERRLSATNDRDRSTAVGSEVRDPYATSNRDRRTERTYEVRDPYAKNDRDHRIEGRSKGRDPYAKNDRDGRTGVRPEIRDPYAKTDCENRTEGRSEGRDPCVANDRDNRPEFRSGGRDPYVTNDRANGTEIVRSEGRDPYATNDRGDGVEVTTGGRDPYATNDRDNRTGVRSEGRDPYVANDRDRGTQAARDDRAADVRDPRMAVRDPRLVRQASQAPGGAGRGKEGDVKARPGRDPYAPNREREVNEQLLSGDSSKIQNNGLQTQTDAAEPKKRKQSDGPAGPGPVAGDRRATTGDSERLQSYEALGDGAVRRRLSEGARDPGTRDQYASRDSLRQSEPASARPVLPPLVSTPAPVPTDPQDDRRPADQARRFTYGSVRRERVDDGCTVIPYEWLSQPMDTMEWRDLRHNTFTKGNDVDRLAFKMLQEILLSPVLGVSSQSLAPFSRGMLAAVRNQLISPDSETFAKFDDFPEALSVRDENYTRADPEWQRFQTPEQMAVRLVGDNIVFSLNSYEDSEAAHSTEPHNFPRRGSFGQNNMTKSTRDGGIAPRYPDSLERDELFNELYDHLLRKNLGG